MAEEIDLLADPGRWSAAIDRGGTTMELAATPDAPLGVHITVEGGDEDYPKLRLGWTEPQDFSRFARLMTRVRVSCDDPEATGERRLAFVFYDEETRRQDLEDHPMTQQVIGHQVPVGRWVDLRDWLLTIHRRTIRQFDIYLYEQPADKPVTYRWEFARLAIEGVGAQAVAFDTEIYEKGELRGEKGEPTARVATEDGLEIVVGDRGEISQVLLDGKQVGAVDGQPTGLVVRDAVAERKPTMVGGSVEQRDGEVRQKGRVEELGVEVEATYRAAGPYIEVAGKVRDLRGEDRAVTLGFALPVDEGPWQWWDSAAVARTEADALGELMYCETGMQYGLNGVHSKYPLGAVTQDGRAGLTLAVRMDEPVVHRIAYGPGLRLFHIALDFGLVPETAVDGRSLAEAPFRILVYRHDPAWGFRSALERYYGFFPQFFTKRVSREGGWFVWGDMSKTEGALEAGFGFHWGPAGAEAVKWDNEHGVPALFYIEAETYQQTMEDLDRAPSFEEVMSRLRKLADGDAEELAKVEDQPYKVYPLSGSSDPLRQRIQTTAQVVLRSVNHNAQGQPYGSVGQFGWMSKSRWGAILPCNLSPGIPGGKGSFNRQEVIEPALESMHQTGAHYDGLALDSLGGYGHLGRANYRREHFRYTDIPLSFGALDRKPVQVAHYGTVEWLRELAEDMHERGLVLMANCSWHIVPGWLTFAAPYLDVFGAEAVTFGDPDFIRAIAYRKPCTNLPYNPRPEWEVARHLLHGIHLGHGNDLEVMKRYAGVLQEIAAAGWEPITLARAEPAGVQVERYGGGRRALLVVHNPAPEPVQARVTVDAAAIGMPRFATKLALTGEEVKAVGDALPVSLEGQGTAVLVLEAQ